VLNSGASHDDNRSTDIIHGFTEDNIWSFTLHTGINTK